MSVLEMCHEREPLPLHPVTPRPHAGDVVAAQRTVHGYRVVLDFFGSFVSFHTSSPLAQEWLLSIYLH